MLKLDATFADNIDVAVVECMTSSSMVAFSSSDLWSFHYWNPYGMLDCDVVVVFVVAIAIAIAVASVVVA
jgi:hypothetical protein